jgi:hypothetical protein
MTTDERMAAYRRQSGRLTLTDRQYRQVFRMETRAQAKVTMPTKKGRQHAHTR